MTPDEFKSVISDASSDRTPRSCAFVEFINSHPEYRGVVTEALTGAVSSSKLATLFREIGLIVGATTVRTSRGRNCMSCNFHIYDAEVSV